MATPTFPEFSLQYHNPFYERSRIRERHQRRYSALVLTPIKYNVSSSILEPSALNWEPSWQFNTRFQIHCIPHQHILEIRLLPPEFHSRHSSEEVQHFWSCETMPRWSRWIWRSTIKRDLHVITELTCQIEIIIDKSSRL